MPRRNGTIIYDQGLVDRLCRATGVSRDQMRRWIRVLAEGIGYELPRQGVDTR